MALTVPVPIFSVDETAVSEIVADKPITLNCAPVRFPDGTILATQGALTCGYRLFRRDAAGSVEVWDEQGCAWSAESDLPAPSALAFMVDQWQMILVAKDKEGGDKLATDPVSGYPEYFARCTFRARDAQGTVHEGASPDSAPLKVYSTASRMKAGLVVQPQGPFEGTDHDEVRIYLKDSGLAQERGVVRIRRSGDGCRVELFTSANGASVRIEPDGGIVLSPAVGGVVRIEGDLQVTDQLTAGGRIL